jgi:broad specificity phosphatase PhoE
MAEFYVVRHGQASFGARNYDKLSPLGIQQSVWLGEHFANRNISFEKLWLGEMVRHQETAQGICSALPNPPKHSVYNGLNEFDFQNIANAYLALNPGDQVAKGSPPAAFYILLKKAMAAWAAQALPEHELRETWPQFRARVAVVLEAICEQHSDSPILVVSSGGAISMLLSLVLSLDDQQVIELNMQIKNAGFSHFFYNRDQVRLSSFNNVPHLDTPERTGAVTFS